MNSKVSSLTKLPLLVLYFHFGQVFGQINLVVNGNLTDNTYYAIEDDSGETTKGLPFLDNHSLLFIRDFKGIFCYPYPDSIPYIALRYGFGFLPTHCCMKKEHRQKSSEIIGKFGNELVVGSIYNFQMTYLTYWGNCLIQDSLSLDLLNKNGETVQRLKFFIGDDKPFQYKTISIDFMAIEKSAFFKLHINYNDSVKKINAPQFFDSSILKRKYIIQVDKTRHCCNCYTQNEFDEEVRMRKENPFVYYLFNRFSCVSSYDSSKYCQQKIDTTLVSNIFFKNNSNEANIQTILSRELNLNGKEVLVKGYSDMRSDIVPDLKKLSESRANSVKDLLKEHYDCNVTVMYFGSDNPVITDPYMTLNKRVEVYEITKKFIKCIDIRP